jgi:hypothetical protein
MSAMGAVLQQWAKNACQSLAFFSKELNPAQQKYSAYDRELLATYEAVKHFCHMLEACHLASSQTTNLSPTTSSRNETNVHQGNSTIWISQQNS